MFETKKKLRERIEELEGRLNRANKDWRKLANENNDLKRQIGYSNVITVLEKPNNPLTVVDTLVNSCYDHQPTTIFERTKYECYSNAELRQIGKLLLTLTEEE